MSRTLQHVKVWLVAAGCAVFVCGLALRPAAAQVLYGSIIGTVTDASDAAVPDATVTVTNRDTGHARDAVTDTDGRYSLVNVLPGRYDLKVTAKGFRTYSHLDIPVSPDIVARVDVKMEVGQITETVTVEATAAVLQTDKGDTHAEIHTHDVVGLPMPNYRNYEGLVNLVPGATPTAFQNSITDTPGRALAMHINGGNSQTNITRIDGATSVNVWLPHHVGYVTPAENIDYVNITTSAADAEQGMAGASAITVVTKSGTNDIHGSAFEFHDDQHLKARNFFQAVGTQKPLSIYNNFGGTVGGPIVKNKLFYFVSYDGTRQRQGGPGFYTVPTAAQRAGDFSGISTLIYDPSTGAANGTGRTPFPGNKLPRLDPIALKLQSYYPLPNVPNAPNPNANNYTASGGPVLSRNYFDTKINFTANQNELIWGKYGRMWATSGGQAVFGIAGGPGLPGGDPGLGNTLIQVGTIGQTHTFSPHVLLDSVFGYERQGQHVFPNDYGTNYGLQFGIPNTNGPDPLQSGFPNIGISNYTGFGVPSWMPLLRVEESYTHSDNVTWTKGAHEFRFGFDLVRHHLNHWQPEIGQGPRGYLGIGGGETALNGGASINQFNAYAAFLLGLSDDAEKSLQYILMTGREWQLGWYARDRWQVSRKLTINLGLRYEFYPLMTRAGKGIERYDPTNNNVYLGGRGSVPDNAGISVSHKLFAPRLGIAYRASENTVIRTGYGINFDPLPFSRPLRGWYPLTVNQANVAPNSYATATTFAQGVPNTQGPDLSTGIIPLPANVSERSPWGYIHRGYTQSWNFTVERKLPQNVLLSAGYVGQHSVHLLADRDINSGFPGSGTGGLPYNAIYGRTIPTNMWDGYLSSNYHSLQVALNRSFKNGLMLKGAYTYSKAIDYADDDGWVATNWNWAPVFQRNRAPAGFDRTQDFQIAWVYELPLGKGKPVAQSGVAAAILGNWQVNGLIAAYTGTPFNVTASGASLNAPNNLQTANQIAPVVQLGNVGPGQYYYDKSSFAPVTIVGFGSMGRNRLRNPGVWNTDLDITRDFPIRERLGMSFRAEFFNFPNTAHFNGPTGSITSGTFMQITSSYGERQIRFSLRAHW